ncbi:MAG TPA: nuclear transport factor 2 family protein, partial [Terriglobales bacterium]|nr:nuclear transport factor 2 family protein [Terriglobales bacterium]
SRIRELSQDLCTAFNTGNYDQVSALFHSEGLFMAPGNEPVQGPKAIERKFREFGENGYQNLRMETTRLDCSGDMAIEVGRYSVALRDANGNVVEDRGKYLKVWRRLGAWLIVGDCWSSSMPKSNEGQVKEMPLPASKKSDASNQDVAKSA